MSKEKLTLDDGTIYEGETLNGKPNGKGNILMRTAMFTNVHARVTATKFV